MVRACQRWSNCDGSLSGKVDYSVTNADPLPSTAIPIAVAVKPCSRSTGRA